jgi:hypothetical protein
VLGYARLDKSFLLGDGVIERGLRSFEAACHNQIPIDPYNASGLFRRRYGRAIYLAWSGHISYFPDQSIVASDDMVACYQQPAQFNPEHEGRKRWFSALLPTMRKSGFLRNVIKRCGSILPQKDQAWHVGIHLQKMVATMQGSALASPNCVHRDGEPFTFAFLIDRKNIIGGENVIAVPSSAGKSLHDVQPSEMLECFILEESWSGWVVNDRLVAHALCPIALRDQSAGLGYRTALLIDYTPLLPCYLQE